MPVNTLIALVILFVFLIVLLGLVVFAIVFFRHWIRAFLTGTKVTLFDLIGMRLRGSDMSSILDQCVAANQAGHPISCKEMEQAHLQKVDIEKVTLAYIAASKRREKFSFQELVDAERQRRLEEILNS